MGIEKVLKTVRALQGKAMGHGKLTRRTAQQIHALRRLEQRYRLKLKPKDYLLMCHWIQEAHKELHPRAMFIKKMNHRLSKWLVSWEDHRLFCVYDKKRNRIATFLAPGME